MLWRQSLICGSVEWSCGCRGIAAEQPDLKGFLSTQRHVAGLSLQWVLFGSSGHKRRPAPGGPLRHYNKCTGELAYQMKCMASTFHLCSTAMLGDTVHDCAYRCACSPSDTAHAAMRKRSRHRGIHVGVCGMNAHLYRHMGGRPSEEPAVVLGDGTPLRTHLSSVEAAAREADRRRARSGSPRKSPARGHASAHAGRSLRATAESTSSVAQEIPGVAQETGLAALHSDGAHAPHACIGARGKRERVCMQGRRCAARTAGTWMAACTRRTARLRAGAHWCCSTTSHARSTTMSRASCLARPASTRTSSVASSRARHQQPHALATPHAPPHPPMKRSSTHSRSSRTSLAPPPSARPLPSAATHSAAAPRDAAASCDPAARH
jgi:hypothetical protein